MNVFVINILTITISAIMTLSIIVNLIVVRKNKDNNKLDNARIQIVVLLVIYVIYGFLRNLL